MHPRLRLWLVGTLGALAAVLMGIGLANESLFLSILAVGVLFWAILEWAGGPLPEAWLLAAILAGYIIGNRGFAQFSLSSGVPLLPAETVLLVALPALGARMAFGSMRAFYRDGLNYAILAWVVLGAGRLPLDFSHHGFFALRDFAMVYYTAFFFLSQALAGHAASARLLKRALTAAFVALPLVAAVEQWVPGYFFTHFTVRGVPLIYHKNDLLAAGLAGGFFWLWTRYEKDGHRLWLVPAAANLLMVGATASPRAAMFALGVVTLMWLVARRWRIAAAQVLIVGTAVSVAIFIATLGNKDPRQTAVYSTYEHAVSIFDLEATGSYVNKESGDPGLNNRFRLIWWRTVVQDTLAQNPVLGLGFGYDLAARFLIEYELLAAEDFATRSPHSMLVSVLGRMGFVGLGLWLAVAGGMLYLTGRCFSQDNLDAIGLVSLAWVLWFSACFGVVLEGPMGAVVFWTALGLANAGLTDLPADEPVLAEDLQPAAPPDEVAASL